MPGLGVDEQLVDRRHRDVVDQPEVHAHADLRQVVHGFFAADLLGRRQNPHRPADVVVQILAALADQEIAGFAFVHQDLRHDVLTDQLDQIFFLAAQRHLVADLIKVAAVLRPLAVQPADGDVDLLHRFEDLLDLAGDDQSRQVQHHADPQPRADVGRTRRQVAVAGVVGVQQHRFEVVVDAVDAFPGAAKVQAALHHLDAQMVFLVDHHAVLFVRGDRHGAAALGVGQFPADQLAFD